MLGAIIGDIVGSRWEFNPTNDYNFEWLSDQNGFTDDTICTVAVADALLHGRDFGESIHDWCNRYPHPMGGYGGRFAQWVRSENPLPYNSFGNGSAMRVSPVAHWFDTLDEVLDAAAATAIPSHNHDEGIKGAQTVAMAIFKALQYGHEAPLYINNILEECLLFSGYDLDIRRADVVNRFDETCQGTVPVALWIISDSTSFEDAVRKAVSLGADADTVGAIVGSISEAIWGIPKEIEQSIISFLTEEMKEVVEKYPRPAVTADCIVITKEPDPKVLLIERGDEPFKGCWAFPGGFMNMDETTEQCAIRELEEETGLRVSEVHQIGAYSKVDRDPRGRTITVAYLAIIDEPVAVTGQDDAAKAEWWPLSDLPHLAFDHYDIIQDAVKVYNRHKE